MNSIIIALIVTSPLLLFIGSYYLFRDTLNRIQYLECLRLYWITKDNADEHTPRLSKAFMRQDTAPFWRGRGVQVRYRRWTFQIGYLQGRADSLADQIGRWLEIEPKRLRKWGDGEHDEETE